MAITRKQVLILGAYPPPAGGISVHTARLSEAATNLGMEATVLDFYGRSVPLQHSAARVIRPRSGVRDASATLSLAGSRFDLVHLHVSGFGSGVGLLQVLVRFVKARRRLVTIHSGSFVARMRKASHRRQRRILRLLDCFDVVICVANEQRDWLVAAGIPMDRVVVLPAFLPPIRAMDANVERIVTEIKRGTDHLIVTSGYALKYYGYDTIMDAFIQLRSCGIGVGLVLAFYSRYDESYVDYLERRLDRFDQIRIFRDLTASQFNDVLYHADTYVRATDRDGDAVAVREALFWGCDVAATDVVSRPDGVDLFPLGDSEALAAILRKHVANARVTESGSDSLSTADQLLNLYLA